MVNREPYATSPAQLCEEVDLPLLGQFEPESRFLERLGHLGEFALDPMRSAHIYHAILDAMGNPRKPPVLWVAYLPGSWEQAPCAVGLAETACSLSEGSILAQVADMHLPTPTGAMERLEEEVQAFIDNLMGRPMAFWGSDLAGVIRALPSPESDAPIPTLNRPEGPPGQGNRTVLILSAVEEEGWCPPSHMVDGVLLVVSYRDHPLSNILWAKERIRSAGHQLAGLVAAGSGESFGGMSPPPSKPRPAPPSQTSGPKKPDAVDAVEPPKSSPGKPPKPPGAPSPPPSPPPPSSSQLSSPDGGAAVRVDWARRYSSDSSRGKIIFRRIVGAWPWLLVLGLIGGFAYIQFKPGLEPEPGEGAVSAAADSSAIDSSATAVATADPDSGAEVPHDLASSEATDDPRTSEQDPQVEGDVEAEMGETPVSAPPVAQDSQENTIQEPEDAGGPGLSEEPVAAHEEVSDPAEPVETIPENLRDWKSIAEGSPARPGWAAGEERTHEIETRESAPPEENVDEGLPVDLPGWADNTEDRPGAGANNISENQIPGLDPTLYPLTVQVAAFQSGDGARFEVDRLDALGYPADTLWVDIPTKGRYCRVVIGTFTRCETAISLVEELQRHPDVGRAFIVTRGGRGKILWALSHRR